MLHKRAVCLIQPGAGLSQNSICSYLTPLRYSPSYKSDITTFLQPHTPAVPGEAYLGLRGPREKTAHAIRSASSDALLFRGVQLFPDHTKASPQALPPSSPRYPKGKLGRGSTHTPCFSSPPVTVAIVFMSASGSSDRCLGRRKRRI